MSSRSNRWRIVLSLLFCLSLALAPSLAEARAGSHFGGGGSSFGSRGSRTFEHNGGSSMTRSATPSAPMMGGASYGRGNFFQRHPILTGLFGGMLLGHLFGGGFFGHAFGGLFTLLILGFLIWLAFRLFSGRFSGGGGMSPRSVGAAAAPAARFRGRDVGVSDADLSAFQAIHAQVQEAWSGGNLDHLRALMTPEMLGYFNEELTRNASQGVQNIVSNVNLLKGEITESWEEGDLEYATAYMQWSAVDYMVRVGQTANSPDLVVSGNPRSPIEEEEIWTFVRRTGGGNWLLSAVQQV
ncbi:MAG TPA: TIM44-like domain-containing protein [Stellaceae bacterium]|nr:TIM44-like domain-containing protein [Stellaceae bacterium]